MAITKWSIPVEAIGMSQAFATSPPPSRLAGALLQPAEDIGGALKRGVNVCQRQPVNEVFGPLVTKFVRNFGREGATPISVAPMPAFSVASRPSDLSDIMRFRDRLTRPMACRHSCNKHFATLFI